MKTQDSGHRSLDELMSAFDPLPFHKMVARVWRGIQQPADSGEHKWARLQMLRLWSPVSGVAVPLLLALIMVALMAMKPAKTDKTLGPVILTPNEEKPPELVKPPEVIPPTPIEASDPADCGDPSSNDERLTNPNPDPDPFNAQNTRELGDVSRIISIFKMRELDSGNQGPGNPDTRRRRIHGDKPGFSEGSVYAALRWLKTHQETDGSWNTKSGMGGGGAHPAAMTGLALLTFLGHGETPEMPEFGATVEKAMKWLQTHQGPDGGFARAYEHPIATYALCEAYTMTRIPQMAFAATKAVDIIIKGQNPSGGFDYGLMPNARNDTSVMGWCAQALKAAKIAGLKNPGLDECLQKTLVAFRGNYQGSSDRGGFGYTGPGMGGLTGVGVLCHQMAGESRRPEVRGGLAYLMATDRIQWEGATWKNVYYWYYNTQARFQEGGACWETWDKPFSRALVGAQIIEKGAGVGPQGRKVDLGYWDTKNERGGRVMDTTLCTLQLEVYYRYLPSYGKVAPVAEGEKIAEVPDIQTDIDLPDMDNGNSRKAVPAVRRSGAIAL